MFTGLIKETGIIERIKFTDSGGELFIKISPLLASEIHPKSHIAIDGKVLTVLDQEDSLDFSILKFYHSHPEHLNSHSTPVKVNLERAIRFGEEIPGALFYGIPSGKVKIISLQTIAENKLKMEVSWDNELIQYLDQLDQVCLNGVLLQIKEKVNQSMFFELYPETLNLTNFAERNVGEYLNIEIDPMVKKVAQVLAKFTNSKNLLFKR